MSCNSINNPYNKDNSIICPDAPHDAMKCGVIHVERNQAQLRNDNMHNVNLPDVLDLEMEAPVKRAKSEYRSSIDDEEPEDDFIFEFSEDEAEREIQAAALFLEQRHHQEQQEIAAAVSFARELMAPSVCRGDLFHECLAYIGEHRKQHFTGSEFYSQGKAATEFKADWDRHFLEFIRAQIWARLKASGVFSDWYGDGYSSDRYTRIFSRLHADIYTFASSVISFRSPF